jgi:5-methylcytosine-specific restriction endonuclease McrA
MPPKSPLSKTVRLLGGFVNPFLKITLEINSLVYYTINMIGKLNRCQRCNKKKPLKEIRTIFTRSTSNLKEIRWHQCVECKERWRDLRKKHVVPRALKQLVFKRDGIRCLACQHGKGEMDHIIPITKGGETVLDNLQALCQSCNLAKGIKIIDFRNRNKGIWKID